MPNNSICDDPTDPELTTYIEYNRQGIANAAITIFFGCLRLYPLCMNNPMLINGRNRMIAFHETKEEAERHDKRMSNMKAMMNEDNIVKKGFFL